MPIFISLRRSEKQFLQRCSSCRDSVFLLNPILSQECERLEDLTDGIVKPELMIYGSPPVWASLKRRLKHLITLSSESIPVKTSHTSERSMQLLNLVCHPTCFTCYLLVYKLNLLLTILQQHIISKVKLTCLTMI